MRGLVLARKRAIRTIVVTFPDGKKYKTTTSRPYTHAVIAWHAGYEGREAGWCVCALTTQPEKALQAAKRTRAGAAVD